MTIGRRPKRHNPKAERLTFRAELEQCPRCGERLSVVLILALACLGLVI